jgi:hypothetical protein
MNQKQCVGNVVNYLSFGSFWCGDPTCPIPECLLYGENLGDNALLRTKLKRGFTARYSLLADRDVTYFRRLLQQNRNQAKFMTSSLRTSGKVQQSAYKVAKEPHAIAETILMPACKNGENHPECRSFKRNF